MQIQENARIVLLVDGVVGIGWNAQMNTTTLGSADITHGYVDSVLFGMKRPCVNRIALNTVMVAETKNVGNDTCHIE